MATQMLWMWCNKCQGLAWAGFPVLGPCPAGGDHDHSGSGDYVLTWNVPAGEGQQSGWMWCNKCQGLAFADNPEPGPCPAGGDHDHSGSGDYVLRVDVEPETYEQSGWMWCNKCQGLAFADNPEPGPCPAGGDHDHSGSGNYLLAPVVAEGYCVPLSAAPGETIDFHVSGQDSFDVTYLLLGVLGDETQAMGDPEPVEAGVQDTPEEPWRNGCSWDPTFSLTVPEDWRSGIYSAQCSSPTGLDYHIVFIVKPSQVGPGRIAALASTNTWNAYNNWGGRFKYSKPAAAFLSFERPNPGATPIDDDVVPKHRTAAELWVLGWLAAAEYPVDVYTDTDFHNGIPGLSDYAALLLNTHTEYWTEQMLDNLQCYLDGGGNLVNLGGNNVFERVELDLDHNRMIALNGDETTDRALCYFVNLDPPRPEREILGVGTRDDNHGTFAPFEVLAEDHPFFKGTGLRNSDEIGAEGLGGGGASGVEMDTSIPGTAPAGVIVRVQSAADDRGAPPVPPDDPDTPQTEVVLLARGTNTGPAGAYGADMVTYTTAANGLVFSAGSLSFGGSLIIDADLQAIVSNVLDECLRRKAAAA
ncbi:N,N-dimethylformamidase beta subunit family domain-containing protein [Kitasatospora aureofaciens]|uniref:N,N-dimethylformamidase beta subunit family domain-containing protein n=1 Tax=Kitasatospora aureofaciens TaxID=1894 RepID=UPI0036F49606